MSANARSAIAAAASPSRPRSSTDGDGIVSEGRPPGNRADHGDVEAEDADEDRRAGDGDEDPGRRRRDPPADEDDHEAADPERGRRRIDLAEVPGEVADIVDEPLAGRRNAEEARQLVGDHDQRDPGEVPEPDGLREQIGEEAEPGDGPDEQQRSDHEREQPCDGDTLGRIGAGDGDHGGRDERGERRVGAEDENPRRPEHGVGEERDQGRVQAGDGWEPRQLRVGHPLGHEQRREHDAGDEVTPQPLPPVGARNPDPGDERPRSTRGRRSRLQSVSLGLSRAALGDRLSLSPALSRHDARASATSSSRSRIAA